MPEDMFLNEMEARSGCNEPDDREDDDMERDPLQLALLRHYRAIQPLTFEVAAAKFTRLNKPRPMRGSEILTREMWGDSVTYNRVLEVHADGRSSLDCGHVADASERNPAFVGQVRFCGVCTEQKFEAMGGNR